MHALWLKLSSEEAGATMVEYGLLVALIAIIAAIGAAQFGISVNENLFCMAATVSGVPCP